MSEKWSNGDIEAVSEACEADGNFTEAAMLRDYMKMRREREQNAGEAVGKGFRFFMDHGVIHDRKTGKHVNAGTNANEIENVFTLLHEMECESFSWRMTAKAFSCFHPAQAVSVPDGWDIRVVGPSVLVKGPNSTAPFYASADSQDVGTMILAMLCRDMLASAPTAHAGEYRHKWSDDGERCVKCGDKDWMGGPCHVPDEPTAPAGDGGSHE